MGKVVRHGAWVVTTALLALERYLRDVVGGWRTEHITDAACAMAAPNPPRGAWYPTGKLVHLLKTGLTPDAVHAKYGVEDAEAIAALAVFGHVELARALRLRLEIKEHDRRVRSGQWIVPHSAEEFGIDRFPLNVPQLGAWAPAARMTSTRDRVQHAWNTGDHEVARVHARNELARELLGARKRRTKHTTESLIIYAPYAVEWPWRVSGADEALLCIYAEPTSDHIVRGVRATMRLKGNDQRRTILCRLRRPLTEEEFRQLPVGAVVGFLWEMPWVHLQPMIASYGATLRTTLVRADINDPAIVGKLPLCLQDHTARVEYLHSLHDPATHVRALKSEWISHWEPIMDSYAYMQELAGDVRQAGIDPIRRWAAWALLLHTLNGNDEPNSPLRLLVELELETLALYEDLTALAKPLPVA